jgi:hypothetical protein
MITQEIANSLFEYKDGQLFRKVRASQNTQIGDLAGYVDKKGYWKVSYKNKSYLLHRIIWLMRYGNLPKELDHIDGNPQNNRIKNLRIADRSQNNCNKQVYKTSSTGIKNVTWYKPTGKWMVKLTKNKKQMFFGYFDDLELAKLVAIEARDKFHKEYLNHG